MQTCSVCGRELTLIESFKCDFCKQTLCTEHRLAENHICPKAPKRTPIGHWKAKPEFDDYVVESKVLGVTRVKSKKKEPTLSEKVKLFFRKKG